MNELQVLTDVTQMLSGVKTVKDAKNLRDKAEAVRQYYKASRKGLEAQNQAAFVKLMCERRGGELLLLVPRAERVKGEGLRAMLAHSELPESTARRWQYLAQFPEADLREMVAICNDEQDELTTTRVVMEAKGYLERVQARASAKTATATAPAASSEDVDASVSDETPEDADEPTRPTTRREPDPQTATPPRTVDIEAIRTLVGLFGQAKNICDCYPSLSSMGGTLTRWVADLAKKGRAK